MKKLILFCLFAIFIYSSNNNLHENASCAKTIPNPEIDANLQAGPSITITSPNGGETLQKGRQYTITWNSNLIALPLTISLYKSGVFINNIATGVYYMQHSYDFVPSTSLADGNDYKIKISDGSTYDFSDAGFTIQSPPEITITFPNGGETLYKGQSTTITWTSKYISSSLVISLMQNRDVVQNISTSASDNGSFTFTPSNSLTSGSNFKIHIKSVADSVYDYSDQYFSVTDLPKYNLTLSGNPSEGGNLSGAGTYDSGSTVTINASVKEGFTFINWTEYNRVVSTANPYSFTLNSDRSLVANFNKNSYTINLLKIPVEAGSISGGGTFEYGTQITIKATSNSDYEFTNWKEGSTVISTDSNYTFTVTANRTLTANFTKKIYSIAVNANPTDGGTVSGDGTYESGSTVTVSAKVKTGYSFTNWEEGSKAVSSDSNYTFTVTGNRTLIANFTKKTYTITVNANPTDGGTVTGDGTYDSGSSVTISAKVKTGYNFTNWKEGSTIVSSDSNYTFTVTGSRTLTANFSKKTYTITVSANPSEGGTVSGSGTYDSGSSVTVSAKVKTGYSFTNWKEGSTVVSADSNYTFTVTGNRTLTADFSKKTYTITVSANPAEGGTVSGSGTYDSGSSVTVAAKVKTGYSFTNWKEGSTVVSADSNYSFTVSGSRTLTANFIKKSYIITINANPTDGGTVSGSGTYDSGSSVTVAAKVKTGYSFTNWNEGSTVVSSDSNYTFTVTGNRTLTANFAKKTYTITVNSNPSEGGTVSGSGTYDNGSSVTVAAKVKTGYIFTNWKEGSTVVSADSNYTFTVTRSRTLTANFSKKTYTITVSANPAEGGTISGGGTYESGASVTVSAKVKPGFSFTNWKEGSTVVSADSNYSFTVTGSRTLTANFTRKTYTITVIANPTDGGTVSGGGSYTYGEKIKVIAIAKDITGIRFKFTKWTENINEVSLSPEYEFVVDKNRNLVANFENITGISENEVPTDYALLQNYPNPFNPSTTIGFTIPEESFVIIKIYNIQGKEIAKIVSDRKQPGKYLVVFNAQNLPSGTYLYRMEASGKTFTKKFQLIK